MVQIVNADVVTEGPLVQNPLAYTVSRWEISHQHFEGGGFNQRTQSNPHDLFEEFDIPVIYLVYLLLVQGM